jgi:acyl dehydratase
VFAGDTHWAESEVTGVRESRSRPSCGIVSIRTRGVNQRAEVVIEFTRSFMVFKSDAPEVADVFPATDVPWTVGADS